MDDPGGAFSLSELYRPRSYQLRWLRKVSCRSVRRPTGVNAGVDQESKTLKRWCARLSFEEGARSCDRPDQGRKFTELWSGWPGQALWRREIPRKVTTGLIERAPGGGDYLPNGRPPKAIPTGRS